MATLQKELVRVGKSVDRILSAYQEGLVSLEQLRERIPPLRPSHRAVACGHSGEAGSTSRARRAEYPISWVHNWTGSGVRDHPWFSALGNVGDTNIFRPCDGISEFSCLFVTLFAKTSIVRLQPGEYPGCCEIGMKDHADELW